MMVGKIIERARIEKGWTRDDLAGKTLDHVSPSTIKRVERNRDYKISVDKLLALSKALDIDFAIFQKRP